MSNLKFSRVVGRIKALNKCRNWPKGSSLLGDSLPKSGNFCHFLAPRSHPALRLTWNFARSSGPMCPSSVPNFKWIGASSRPCVAKCWFLIQVNFTGRRGNPAGKERERESCCRTVVLCCVVKSTSCYKFPSLLYLTPTQVIQYNLINPTAYSFLCVDCRQSFCGDSVRNNHREECDGHDVGYNSCATYKPGWLLLQRRSKESIK